RADRQHLEGRGPPEDGEGGAGRLEPDRRRTVVVEQPGEEGREVRRLPLVGELECRHAATASSSTSSVYSRRNSRSSSVRRRGRCRWSAISWRATTDPGWKSFAGRNRKSIRASSR